MKRAEKIDNSNIIDKITLTQIPHMYYLCTCGRLAGRSKCPRGPHAACGPQFAHLCIKPFVIYHTSSRFGPIMQYAHNVMSAVRSTMENCLSECNDVTTHKPLDNCKLQTKIYTQCYHKSCICLNINADSVVEVGSALFVKGGGLVCIRGGLVCIVCETRYYICSTAPTHYVCDFMYIGKVGVTGFKKSFQKMMFEFKALFI